MFATTDDVLFSKFAFCLDNSLLLVALPTFEIPKPCIPQRQRRLRSLQQASSDLTNSEQAGSGQAAAPLAISSIGQRHHANRSDNSDLRLMNVSLLWHSEVTSCTTC